LITARACEFVALTLNTAAVCFVAAIGAVNYAVAALVAFDTLTSSATELILPTIAIGFVGTVAAVASRVAFAPPVDASAIGCAPELVLGARRNAIGLVGAVAAVHLAVTFTLDVDAAAVSASELVVPALWTIALVRFVGGAVDAVVAPQP